jgi:hypothetical protein
MNWKAMSGIAAAAALAVIVMAAPARMMAQQGGDTVLKAAEAQKLLPASVFYAGKSATTQLRNSGGVKFADGHYVLATLVDTSGYSTGIAAKYQAYFIVEVPIKLGGQDLPAGIYGIGFVAGNKLVVTDVGAHDVITVSTDNDAAIQRPTPLQVVADPAGGFRLYAGRAYVSFSR